jgi:hypothetical protein
MSTEQPHELAALTQSPAQVIILNGAPRSGKSSIAAAIQESFQGVWMNLGVDHFMAMAPPRYRPGIGLRPGGERPDLEPLVAVLYAAMYESIAAHSRLGLCGAAGDLARLRAAPARPAGALRWRTLPPRRDPRAAAAHRLPERGRGRWRGPGPGSALAGGRPSARHLRPGGRHVAAHAGRLCRAHQAAPSRRRASVGVPAACRFRLTRRGVAMTRATDPARCATARAARRCWRADLGGVPGPRQGRLSGQ